MKTVSHCHLYGILDLAYVAEFKALDVAEKMIEAGVDILQLRAKNCDATEISSVARELISVTKSGGVPLIVNDFPAIARDVGAEGVHVGQDDTSIAEAREIFGREAIVGRSTHSVEQAIAAEQEGADYIGFGPLFSTPTKPDYAPIGLDAIARVHERVCVPIFCIGGIKLENLTFVLAAGAKRVVIVSGILQAADIAAYACKAKAMLLENPNSKIKI